MSVSDALILFAVTFSAALVTCPLAARVGSAVGIVDSPRPGEVQRRPTARSGGYGIILAFLIGVGVTTFFVERTGEEWMRLYGLLAGMVPLLVVAVIDDLYRLKPGPQAIGHLLAAGAAMAFGLVIDSVANPWGTVTELAVWIAIPFTVFWIVGMINTVNFLDTMDGVAGGVAAIAAAVLFARSIDLGQTSVATLPLVLGAACLGFLVHNFNPARMFMGSSGSLFLGYTLAIMAIFGGAKIATAAMVLGIPILDVALVIVFRRARGRSPFAGGDSALLTQRLYALGWSQRRIALGLYVVCASAGALALSMSRVEKVYLFAGVLVIFFVLVLVVLAQVRRIDAEKRSQAAQPTTRGHT
jgi:UDP-GlcNAc:undecaprenyl-phosphate/decaprenyl-phosphate GlcNAc-1-phosphate transferase